MSYSAEGVDASQDAAAHDIRSEKTHEKDEYQGQNQVDDGHDGSDPLETVYIEQ